MPSAHLPSTPAYLKAKLVRLFAKLVLVGGKLICFLAKPVAIASGWGTLFGELVSRLAKPVQQLGWCSCVKRE